MWLLVDPLEQAIGFFLVPHKEFDETLLEDVTTFGAEPVNWIFTLGSVDCGLRSDSPPALFSGIERDEVLQNGSRLGRDGKIAEGSCRCGRITPEVSCEQR